MCGTDGGAGVDGLNDVAKQENLWFGHGGLCDLFYTESNVGKVIEEEKEKERFVARRTTKHYLIKRIIYDNPTCPHSDFHQSSSTLHDRRQTPRLLTRYFPKCLSVGLSGSNDFIQSYSDDSPPSSESSAAIPSPHSGES